MAQLEYNNKGFARRAWKMIRRDPGWYKPILVMSVANLIPIVGSLGNTGYAFEWARVTAWGQESAPKQKGVKVGACIKSGFRAAVVTLAWTLILLIVDFVLGSLRLPGLAGLVMIAIWVIGLFWTLIAQIAALNATIYQRVGAGFALKRIWSMLKSDFGGFMHLWVSNLLYGLVVGIISIVVAYALILPSIGMLVGGLAYFVNTRDMSTSIWMLSQVVSQLTLPLALLIIVTNIFNALSTLMVPTMCALWVMHFDVASWGDPNESVVTPTAHTSVSTAPITPSADQFMQQTPQLAEPAPDPQAEQNPRDEQGVQYPQDAQDDKSEQ